MVLGIIIQTIWFLTGVYTSSVQFPTGDYWELGNVLIRKYACHTVKPQCKYIKYIMYYTITVPILYYEKELN